MWWLTSAQQQRWSNSVEQLYLHKNALNKSKKQKKEQFSDLLQFAVCESPSVVWRLVRRCQSPLCPGIIKLERAGKTSFPRKEVLTGGRNFRRKRFSSPQPRPLARWAARYRSYIPANFLLLDSFTLPSLQGPQEAKAGKA